MRDHEPTMHQHEPTERQEEPTERQQIADSFEQLGPEAPTILPGWGASELLEHLLLRERHALALAGSLVPGPLTGFALQRRRRQLAELSFSERVQLLREGPGPLSPTGRIDQLTGDGELLIHHEDLRRAQGGWEPRRLSARRSADVWRTVRRMAPVMAHIPAQVTLISPLGGLRLGSRWRDGSLRVHGDVMELLLWVSGRDEVARVRIHGDPVGLQALAEGRRGA